MRRQARFFGAALGLSVVALLLACDDTTSGPEGEFSAERVTAVSVAPTSAAISVGESISLRATVRGAEGEVLQGYHKITWTSSAPTTVRVSANGVATGETHGQAMITAGCGDVCGYARVTVRGSGDDPDEGETR